MKINSMCEVDSGLGMFLRPPGLRGNLKNIITWNPGFNGKG